MEEEVALFCLLLFLLFCEFPGRCPAPGKACTGGRFGLGEGVGIGDGICNQAVILGVATSDFLPALALLLLWAPVELSPGVDGVDWRRGAWDGGRQV